MINNQRRSALNERSEPKGFIPVIIAVVTVVGISAGLIIQKNFPVKSLQSNPLGRVLSENISAAPEMVYPTDGQSLAYGSPNAYMFKVKPVSGANGYLFGFFQNGTMIYENWRDDHQLSSNGEFAVWSDNSHYSSFKEGTIEVVIRAQVNGQWSDARTIKITLGNQNAVPAPTPIPVPPAPTPPTPPQPTPISPPPALDTTPPTINVTGQSINTEQICITTSITDNISTWENNGLSYTYELGAGNDPWNPPERFFNTRPKSPEICFLRQSLTTGSHALRIWAKDAAGNRNSKLHTFVVPSPSTPPPTPPTTPPPSTPIPIPTPTTKPDLDVTYISRTPRYERYNVCYNPNPSLCGGQTQSTQRWPNPGQNVTFTAHIKNKSDAQSGNFAYQWKIDGYVRDSGNISSIEGGKEITKSLDWIWLNGPHLIEFSVDTANTISEASENNNKLSEYSNALTYRIHVEKSVYDKFNSLKNLTGSYSFEDWIQGQIQGMRNEFTRAGINEKIKIDEIIIESNGVLSRSSTHAPEDWNWDGRWGFETTEWTPSNIEKEAGNIQKSLIHELTHQLGVIDDYNLNYDWNYVTNNKIIPQCSQFTLGKIQPQGYESCVFYNPKLAGIMTGSYDRPYSLLDTEALNGNLGFRRGYFGEYLYDIPKENKIRVLDKNGSALTNAQLDFYQKTGCHSDTKLSNTVIFSGSTDKGGYFTLPNRAVVSLTTETGHTLNSNPFGNIDVNGCNGVFLIKIQFNNQIDYRWLDISTFNLAYRTENRENATYTINTALTSNSGLFSIPFSLPFQIQIPFIR